METVEGIFHFYGTEPPMGFAWPRYLCTVCGARFYGLDDDLGIHRSYHENTYLRVADNIRSMWPQPNSRDDPLNEYIVNCAMETLALAFARADQMLHENKVPDEPQ